MENSILDNDFGSDSEIGLSSKSMSFLKESAKWGKFLAIVGFIMLGFIVIAAFYMFYMSSILGNFGGQTMIYAGIGYLLMAVLYLFPTLYLYNFSVNTKIAIQSRNINDIDMAFENLKKMFKFMGVVMIVVLSLYLLVFLFGAGTAMLR